MMDRLPIGGKSFGTGRIGVVTRTTFNFGIQASRLYFDAHSLAKFVRQLQVGLDQRFVTRVSLKGRLIQPDKPALGGPSNSLVDGSAASDLHSR